MVQQFATRLRQAAKDCAFAGDINNQIRDAVVGKCSSAYVRRKLLEEGPNLTLDRTMEVAALCERIEEQMSASLQQQIYSTICNLGRAIETSYQKGHRFRLRA